MLIVNTTARLLWGPKVQGQPAMKLLPGDNHIEQDYLDQARKNRTFAKWLEVGLLKIDKGREAPNPNRPPTRQQMRDATTEDLQKALEDERVPPQWHSHIEAELKRRKEEEMRAQMPGGKSPAQGGGKPAEGDGS